MKSAARRLGICTGCILVVLALTLVLNQFLARANENVPQSFPGVNENLLRITYSAPQASIRPSISGDGAKIAFVSTADLLDQNHDFRSEIWLYNAQTISLTRVTFSETPGAAFAASISADGNKIAFSSDYDFEQQQAQDGFFDIWVYDANTGQISRVTDINSSTTNTEPSVNADGAKIAFSGNSDFFNSGDVFGREIWLYDSATMTVTRVTNNPDTNRNSVLPSINADGTRLAFQSDADLLGQGVLGGQNEIWLYDANSPTLTRVTTSTGTLSDSTNPSISADGTKIAFDSLNDILNQGIPPFQSEIWLYDTTTMTYTRITTAVPNGRDSTDPSISADGTKIAFRSDSDFLNQGIVEGQHEMWLYDLSADTFTRLTYRPTSGGSSSHASLNGDGTILAFQSQANFHDNSPPTAWDIWLSSIPMTPTIFNHFVYLPVILNGEVMTSTPVVWEDDDFDNLNLGSLNGQNGWVQVPGDRSSPEVVAEAGGNILEIEAGTDATIIVGKDVPNQSDGRHTLSFRVRVTDAVHPSLAKIEVQTTSANLWGKKFQVYFGNSMRLNYGPTPGQAYTFLHQTEMGRWYDIRLEINLDAELVSVFVDDALAASNIPIYPGHITNLGISGWDRPGKVDLDDLLGVKN